MKPLKYLFKNPSMVKGGVDSMKILLPLGLKAMIGKMPPKDCYATSSETFDREKEEIMQRLNWLCERIIVAPKELLNSYPPVLGDYYGPQWSIYSCVMLITSLSNVARIWTDLQSKCINRIGKLLPLLLSKEIRQYDAKEWREDPIDSLRGNKHHLSYVSLLAWSIEMFKLAGGSNKYDQLLIDCCEALSRRMRNSPDLNLKTFPNRPVFFPDMLVAIAALKYYSRIFDGQYEPLVSEWLNKCKKEWLHKRTGLISAFKYGDKVKGIRGSYTAANNFWLTHVDESLAKNQYERMKKFLGKSDKFTGIKEYLNKEPKLAFDPDAGPIFQGLSPSGIVFALGSSTFFGDWDFRNDMLATAQKLGGDVRKDNTRHYKLGEFSLCGEATALAMRTNKRDL